MVVVTPSELCCGMPETTVPEENIIGMFSSKYENCFKRAENLQVDFPGTHNNVKRNMGPVTVLLSGWRRHQCRMERESYNEHRIQNA